jgi:phosphate:Na+ symporter
MNTFLIIIGLFGGLGLFLYGMSLASEALQKYSAGSIKSIFSRLTKTPIKGILFGIIITFLLQGSTAITVLLVGFVNAGLMTFSNALGVILGSAIGTTLTVQLIAFRITDYALLFVAAGAGLFIFPQKRKFRHIGQIILGFGLVFYGMGVMSTSMDPLKNNMLFTNIMIDLASTPLLMTIGSTIFTVLVQSSAATLAIAMSLAAENIFSIEAAIPIVFGANIGTTATALLSSLSSTREAKRVALANLIFKIIGVLIFYPFIIYFANLIAYTSADFSRQIANAHTFFNIIITIIFLPVINCFAKLIYKLIPEREDELPTKATKYIDNVALDVPEIALWQVKREIGNMGEIVEQSMFPAVDQYINSPNEDVIKELEKKEQQVDYLYVAISKYITNLAERDLEEEQSQEQVKYLYLINDLEHVGDITLSLVRGYRKAVEDGTLLSREGLSDFNLMFSRIRSNYSKALKAFLEEDYELAASVLKNQPEVLKLEKNMRFNHFNRLTSPDIRTPDNSSIYLDMINDLLRINIHSVSICQTVMGIV